ncbi:MAG TPA: AraC family transcriptional regulator [Caulobacteraceae bacterium]|nr:AraC family transcriptional regulator [Caulobacteraceae bacterium]
MSDAEFRLMRFSSDQLPVSERFDIWRDTMTRKLLRLAIDPISEQPFRAKAALRALPLVKVGFGFVGPAIHHRTREIAAAENDDIALFVNLAGRFVIRRPAGETVLEAGDACIAECGEVASYVMPEAGRHLCVRIERRALGAFARHVETAVGRRIPAETEALKLLVVYARTLPAGDAELSPAACRVVVDHLADLMALLVGAGGEAQALAASRGLAAGRLSAVKAHIRENAADIELTPEGVAAGHGISPRYLRQLFESEALSFTAYLLEQRLSQAHAMLSSPRFAAEPISSIAYDVGFGDLSYFNRAFRRRYDKTPRDLRAEAARRWRDVDG